MTRDGLLAASTSCMVGCSCSTCLCCMRGSRLSPVSYDFLLANHLFISPLSLRPFLESWSSAILDTFRSIGSTRCCVCTPTLFVRFTIPNLALNFDDTHDFTKSHDVTSELLSTPHTLHLHLPYSPTRVTVSHRHNARRARFQPAQSILGHVCPEFRSEATQRRHLVR